MNTTPTTWLDSFFTSIPTPVVVAAGSYTMVPGFPWLLISAGVTILFPGRPVVGQLLELTAASGNFGSSNATFNGNGNNINDPQAQYTVAATVTARTSAVTYRYRFDGAIFRCVGMS
jgi:hypothetical protein